MKQKERHHLKENELAHVLASAAGGFSESRRRQLIGASIGVALLVVAVVGFFAVRQNTTTRADATLAAAMVVLEAPVQPPDPAQPPKDGKPGTMATQAPGTYPTVDAKLQAAVPKLKAAADAYPNATPGIVARFHLASTLASLGRHEEALKTYDEVIARAGDSLHGRMARLGKANEEALLGRYEPAIASYKALIEQKDAALPADALLMQLAAAYDAAGNRDEAKKAFSRIVHEHPTSPYSAEAGKQIQ